MGEEKSKSESKKVNVDLGNTIKKPSNNLKPVSNKNKKK